MLKGSILQQLKSALENTNRPLNLGVYYKNTLVALCHALEDCILVSGSQPLVITAFQRGKWYLQEAERYHDLAQKSRHVVIMAAPETGFADHPTSKLPNVDLVALNPEDPVAQEWHLIVLAPSYTAMVLCQELSEADYGVGGRPTIDLERKFYGFWTFEPARVEKTIELAIAQINSYNPELAQHLKSHVQAIAQETSQVEPDDLNTIVTRVVDYLQTSEYSIKQIEHHQVLDSNLVSNELQAFLRLGQLIDLADTGNPLAAAEVAAIAEIMGQLLNLPAWQVKRLRLASLLHRIAAQSVNVQYGEAPSCPLIPAAQVLRTMPRLSAIAQIINHLSEHWDGSGQPAGLIGETIPLESRILGLVADFQQRFTHLSQSHTREEALSTAFDRCQQDRGKVWEPKLVDTLELLVRGMQQGLILPVSPTKISSGMWLIEENSEFGSRKSGVVGG
ncbi:DICT sensory domain-containing protein [Chroococcidiopsis sp.]|uniref:DICT sensory domain-containing protein n=1 Tax=Chroococcidiopsis sp. TaxID=3088168 RepID=UPI003F2A98B4